MSASSSTSVTHSPASASAPAVAVVFLDANGHITATNASARALWKFPGNTLCGRRFPSLFAFEVTASDADWEQAQWEIVLATTLERSALLSVQPHASTPIELSVRLEPSSDNAGGYVAVVQLPAATNRSPTSSHPLSQNDGLSLLVDQSEVGFFDLNFKAGQIVHSPVWKKLLGYIAAELPDTHESWLTHIHPEDTEAAPFFIGKKHTVGIRRISVEFRMRHRLGHYVWLHCTGLQHVSTAGELERVTGFCIDTTERREIEEASLSNDSRLQDLSDGGPLGAFEFNFVQQNHWLSPACCRLLGLGETPPADALAAFTRALPLDGTDTPDPAAWLLSRAPGQNTFLESIELRDVTGRPVPIFLGAHRTLTRKRELARVVGFICPLPGALTGVTLDDGPPLSPQLLAGAFAALTEAVLITDAASQVLFVNHAAARLLLRAPNQTVGHPIDDVFRLADRQTGRPAANPIEAALAIDGALPINNTQALLPEQFFEQTSSPFAVTDSPKTPGSAPRPIVWTASVIRSADREPRGVVIIFRDPNEITLTPDELVKANRFETLGQLAGGIAHDFNNLLTTILGTISLAVQNQDPTPLADAEKACLAAKGLTKQLLLVAKGGVVVRTTVAAREILDDAHRLAAAGTTASVTVTVAPGTDAVSVDRPQILQVFQNLILNAIQAMPPAPHLARVQLNARNVTVGENQIPNLATGAYVEFESRDNGSGIPAENLEKIWDPFFTTKKHGTGLGLATVLSIVRKHGGQIGLSSTVGVGSVFTVYLPTATEQPVEVQARKAPSLRFGTGRVLLMDDDEKISTLTAGMLGSLDYKYDLAKNGEEAVALYKRYLNIGRPYDAVILDLTVVGGMGGEDCFKELRQIDPDLRAIVSSGYDNDDMARRYLEMGFCGYLTKPYRSADLGKILKGILG